MKSGSNPRDEADPGSPAAGSAGGEAAGPLASGEAGVRPPGRNDAAVREPACGGVPGGEAGLDGCLLAARPWPRAARLLRRSGFQRVYSSGNRVSNPFFTAFALHTGASLSRLGLTTPRALGKATIRNRIKRRLREAARLHLPELGAGWDIVFNPRRPACDGDFARLEKEVARLFQNLAKKHGSAPTG